MDALLTLPQAATFLAAAILIAIAPGPDNLMVLSIGMARGRKAGVAFGLGCALGCLNHTLLASLGISALIAASPPAFTALKIAGGLYLVGSVSRPSATRAVRASPAGRLPKRRREAFRQGPRRQRDQSQGHPLLLAFLPQFVDTRAAMCPGRLRNSACSSRSWLSLFCRDRLVRWRHRRACIARRPAIGAWLDRVAGGIFLALGLRLLVVH